MAWISGKAAADLRALLGVATGRRPESGRRCWPGEGDRPELRRCWPDASDAPQGEPSPADVIRKIARGGWA